MEAVFVFEGPSALPGRECLIKIKIKVAGLGREKGHGCEGIKHFGETLKCCVT